MLGFLFPGQVDMYWQDCTAGYDCIIQHLNNGRKNCKEFEDFLKERASIEEKYGKDFLNLSREKPCGQSEINTLKRALEVFKQQIDSVAQCHIQLAQTLREEARKMEEFREKQKLQRKKNKDEAEQAVPRSANLVNVKQQEKLFVKLATAKTAVEDSDKTYMMQINTLDKVREDWQSEHIKACEIFEAQECERINFFRNALWLHLNQLSQQCDTSDDVYEEVRRSLEACSIEKDIVYFVSHRKTGQSCFFLPLPLSLPLYICFPSFNLLETSKILFQVLKIFGRDDFRFVFE
ncbi:unnamed protein product [Nyctereutes procyonoides]|uniref:(raccoon dog) hypothetical protein n=1 Tax=Nyctereutes procyonoides TaxID=34880 RepID=A0A811ZXG5_NYCPR|nr:unnamed protein product [Nyctereutes procyonoides]